MEAPKLGSYPRTPYPELLTYFKHGMSKEVILTMLIQFIVFGIQYSEYSVLQEV